ncbi:uncharacterized protein LOC132272765 [Cornus florida]|uniref:uncharacterized protein LOC132272765 n=1 Tax=Cornus florida TaxID=4283 RepID=UPI0028A24A1B|nr:uncharacterized protein LOC132272765 [Cornus florida]
MQKKIDQFCKRKSKLTSSIKRNDVNSSIERNDDSLKQSRFDINLEDLQADPGLRARIMDYHPNIRDELCRAYYLKGPYIGKQSGDDFFVGEGFSNWKKKEKLKVYVGGPNGAYNQAYRSYEALVNQKQHIQTIFFKQSDQARIEYRTRLTASVDCVRYLLQQGLAFCGHDEADDSNNQGNFLTLLRFHAHHNKDVKAVVLENAPANMKLTSPEIQKEIINSIATEIINFTIRDIGDAFFSILIDESCDVSIKEQMAIVLRYVKNRSIIERFIGTVHVIDTTVLSLKVAIDNVFFTQGLSISSLHGQGYDGASNMQGEFNGLKTLILKENEFAFFVHYIAHQLQLALVAVAKNHGQISTFFLFAANVVNVVGASFKLKELHSQLETYILDVRSNSSFEGLKGISTLAKKMVEVKKDKVYPLVYLLVTLALILPVATTTVKRAISVMNIVKNELRNQMGDQFMNDSLVVYVEKDIFRSIDNEAIMQRFQKMKSRRRQL